MMRTYYGTTPNYQASGGVGSITFSFYPHFYTTSGSDVTASKKVRYRRQGTQQWTEVSVSTSSSSYTLSGLGPNECYEFQALVESTPQGYGTVVSTGWQPATPVLGCSETVPVASLWPHVTESSYRYTVYWSAVPGASSYTVQRSDYLGESPITACSDVTSTSCTGSLSSSSGTAYVRVGAVSADSRTTAWSPMMRTRYGTTPNYQASGGAGSITFSFYPHFYTTSGSDVTSSKKVRYRRQGTQQWTEVSVSTSSSSYTLSGLGPNECYEFQALVESTPQGYGTVVSTGWQPATPVLGCSETVPVASLWPHVTESSYRYTVYWSAVPGASSYTVQRSDYLGESPITACSNTTSTSCTGSLSSSSGTAYVRVGAVSADSRTTAWSPMMRTRYGTTPNYQASGGAGSITFSFYPHFYTTSGSDVTSSKKVRYRRQGTQQWTEVSVSTSSSSYTLSGLGPNECYEFQALVESTPQGYGTVVSTGWQPATPVLGCSETVPVASLWPHVTESSYRYTVYWSAVPGASSYTVQRSDYLGESPITACSNTTSTSCTGSLSSSSGTAYVRVGAVSADSRTTAWSPMMRTRYGTTPNYQASGGAGSITFSFYPHFYTTSGSDVTSSKKVRYRRQGTQQWTEVSVSTSSSSYTLSGLGPNECYEFQALVESTPQGYGTVVSTGWQPATPVLGCSETVPVASLWPHVTESSYRYTVYWSAVPGASSYTVQRSDYLGESPITACSDVTSTSCTGSLSSSSGTAYVRVGAVSADSRTTAWSPMMRTRYGTTPNYQASGGAGSITFSFYPHFYTTSGSDVTSSKKVRYRRQGTQQWTEVSVSTSSSSYTLSGLGPNECYEFQALVESTPQGYGTVVSTGWQPATPVVGCSQ
jgi:uncharacterized membrane protein